MILSPAKNMTDQREIATFQEGDRVVLALGSYQGTMGVFVRFKKDVNWVEIREENGDVRSHPLRWLAHRTAATGSAS